ncbi:hypothetical protein BJ508DRAFT_74528 [Ascobolus immersus RN42]|uniref:Uncharacterized protein n=1 Tax=Ascobolus immersus RN42 TaxID=1160509 RepID=A0A3N4IAT0_ASCIM|nr:hypothetical protein BJ508DRAFT_74528 [Ascobolus immersus RN42]
MYRVMTGQHQMHLSGTDGRRWKGATGHLIPFPLSIGYYYGPELAPSSTQLQFLVPSLDYQQESLITSCCWDCRTHMTILSETHRIERLQSCKLEAYPFRFSGIRASTVIAEVRIRLPVPIHTHEPSKPTAYFLSWETGHVCRLGLIRTPFSRSSVTYSRSSLVQVNPKLLAILTLLRLHPAHRFRPVPPTYLLQERKSNWSCCTAFKGVKSCQNRNRQSRRPVRARELSSGEAG